VSAGGGPSAGAADACAAAAAPPPAPPARPRPRAGRFRAGGWRDCRSTDTWTLGQRNIYILPTVSRLAFALTLVVMLLASINYQLNLGYVLTFLLAGAALVSMHLTHGTCAG
jgi:hypothetical protein